MALGEVVDLSAIPYLDHAELPGRFISTLMFHDGDWRVWLQTEEPGRFVEVKAWPAESFYFARKPENPTDIYSTFLTFIAQRANFNVFQAPFSAIQHDIFNLSAALAKLHLIFETGNKAESGSSRMAATEVEYILLVCRSVFDLLQEILAKIWSKITLTDAAKRKALKKSFSDMTLHANALKSADQIADQFQLPVALAECYVRHAPMFLKVREFRDNLVHRGHKVQTIFRGEEGFLITKRLGPLLDLNIWRDDEVLPNDLVPLKPALALVGTLAACEDFAQVLMTCIQFPNPIVPGMHLFMRGYFNDALVAALADADQRLSEGRSLIAAPVKT